jgi:hypothetical protein
MPAIFAEHFRRRQPSSFRVHHATTPPDATFRHAIDFAAAASPPILSRLIRLIFHIAATLATPVIRRRF